MYEVLYSLIRGVIAYLLLLLITRLVGRKAISQMTFFDFTVGITFGSLAANIGMGSNSTPITAGVTLIIFAALAILTSVAAIKSFRFEKLVDSEPIIVISKGELVKANMKKTRMTLPMLTSLLRAKDCFNISDVEYAIFEKDGKLSVLLKTNRQSLTPGDMDISVPYEGLTAELIIDGRLMVENLIQTGKDEQWLKNELRSVGIKNYRDVFFAALDSGGSLYVSLGIAAKEQGGKYGIE